ncbi:MAG: PAS domain-containing hybrid sensor histidine kinase/response regulator [Thermodesulfobacteriota bacterium]
MKQLHSLLVRQLKRHFGDPSQLPDDWKPFIELVNEAYREFDADRGMLERSLELSSQELLQSNSEMRAVIKALPDLFLWLDREGTILDCKEGSTTNLFLPAHQLVGKRIQNIPDKNTGEKFGAAVRRVQQEKTMISMEYSLLLNGKRHFFESRLIPLLEDQCLCIVRNITERKETEEALRLREEQYRKLYEETKKAEEVYRSLIHSSADAIILYDMTGHVRYVSQVFTQLFGWTLAELEGRKIPFVPESEADSTAFLIKEVAGRGNPVHGFETRRLTRDGRILEVSASASRFNDHEGKPAGTLVVLRDITEKKRLAAHFRQAQKMESIGTLAGGIAHDFNNLLAAIMGYTEMSLAEAPKNSRIEKRLTRVMQASERARDLVNQILTFSRQKEQVKKPLQIRPIVKEAMKLLRASIPSAIQFQVDIAEDTGIILADPTQIHQLIMNLCTNAAHAMQEKGGLLTIGIRNIRIGKEDLQPHSDLTEGEYVGLTVADTGHGMPPHILEKIFDPYFTTKKHGEGTGLGLSLVHGIVKGMEGFIRVSSQPSAGSMFSVFIPRLETDEPETVAEEPALPLGHETILLVEDEDFVLDISREILESLGYTVVARISSLDALQAFRSHPERFQLIISDQMMPNMTGLELALNIRNVHPTIPVILCSGFSDNITEEKVREAGISAFLHKPILKQGLAETVRRVLDNYYRTLGGPGEECDGDGDEKR